MAGTAFSYQFDASSFQSNKVGGQLTYSLQSATSSSLPSWLSFLPGNLTLQGTPDGGMDSQLSLILTATDRDGEHTSQAFALDSFATCPNGGHRHFRLRLLPGNQVRYYETPYSGSYICSLLWTSPNENGTTVMEDGYPSPSYPAFNISGVPYSATYDYPASPAAGFGDLEDSAAGFCSFETSWKARLCLKDFLQISPVSACCWSRFLKFG